MDNTCIFAPLIFSMNRIIGGIQQIGVGVPNNREMFDWYRMHFGTDVKVFDEAAEAPLMIDYTGGQVHSRSAIMALNLQGGGGLEIWQFTSRPTEKASFDITIGDLGIFAARIKSKDIPALHSKIKTLSPNACSELLRTPDGKPHFFVTDPNGNLFNVVQGNHWFKDRGTPDGGVAGAMIGVSDIDKARTFYTNVLGYDKVEYDVVDVFDDFRSIDGGNRKIRRVLLSHSFETKGPFSKLLGPTKVELVQLVEDKPNKIFEGRMWGDWGFIHLCYDVSEMNNIESLCKENGFEFTVDSGTTFDMGDAAGRFSYVEDPDGTLIEFVEAHKMPIMKKWGWFYNLQKRDREKPLPNWIVNALRFSKVK